MFIVASFHLFYGSMRFSIYLILTQQVSGFYCFFPWLGSSAPPFYTQKGRANPREKMQGDPLNKFVFLSIALFHVTFFQVGTYIYVCVCFTVLSFSLSLLPTMISIYLPRVPLPIYLSIYLPTFTSCDMPVLSVCSVYLSIIWSFDCSVFVYLLCFSYLSLFLSIYPSFFPCFCLCDYLSIYLCIYLSADHSRLSVFLSSFPSSNLSVYPPLLLPVDMFLPFRCSFYRSIYRPFLKIHTVWIISKKLEIRF